MKKFMFILVAMVFIAFGYTAGAFAAEKEMGRDASDPGTWFGASVRNPQGEDLGKVDDFVRDKNGDVSLVIISHGGFLGIGAKKVAVPYDAISFNEGEDHAVLDVTKEQLANAPSVNETSDLSNPQFAEEVNRYFGERPQWKGTSDQETPTRGYFGSDDRFDTNRGAVNDMQNDTLPYGDY